MSHPGLLPLFAEVIVTQIADRDSGILLQRLLQGLRGRPAGPLTKLPDGPGLPPEKRSFAWFVAEGRFWRVSES